MVTGDGPLTAFHVAKKVAIARESSGGKVESCGLLLSRDGPDGEVKREREEWKRKNEEGEERERERNF